MYPEDHLLAGMLCIVINVVEARGGISSSYYPCSEESTYVADTEETGFVSSFVRPRRLEFELCLALEGF